MAKSAAPRYPAVPLIVHHPYFSVWSCADRLYDRWPAHWSGSGYELSGQLRMAGRTRVFMGEPGDLEVLPQTGVEVLPTRTVYRFAGAGVGLTLTFLSPVLPHDPALLSRPITYLSFALESLDGAPHRVELYCDFDAGLATASDADPVDWGRYRLPGLEALGLSCAEQRPLARSGDARRIDWGTFYLGVPAAAKAVTAVGRAAELRAAFRSSGRIEPYDLLERPLIQLGNRVVAAAVLTGDPEPGCAVERVLLAGYDERCGIEYCGRRLPAWWRRDGLDFGALLVRAAAEYPQLAAAAGQFDAQLLADARRVGGEPYARLCALSYRQALGAHLLVVGPEGEPWLFSKENSSNGCIATVDVAYPASPLFLLLNPALLKALLLPVFDYAAGGRWPFPFAPHDLGQYPLANGQVYGGGERSDENQMPVEECGNLLLLTAALAEFGGDLEPARRYRRELHSWAEYLLARGYDPENQLCTDDFAGHLAHNANLSLKAILALGAAARLAERLEEPETAHRFRQAAEEGASRWLAAAVEPTGGTRLAFDRPGSWSQKYNLVWDRLLDLKLFPPELAARELAYYRAVQKRYGLPLDSRKSYTKLDWILWCAALTGEAEDFQALLAPVNAFWNTTPDRVPLSDWYETTDARQVGFQARSVVGGVFLRLLQEPELRRRYAAACRSADGADPR